MKVKPLRPTLRERKRYLVYEVISKNDTIEPMQISNAISGSVKTYVGELGLANCGLIFLNDKFNSDMQRGIVRVNHEMTDTLKASLTFINKIDNKNVILRSIGTSGIMKKAIDKYLKHNSQNKIILN